MRVLVTGASSGIGCAFAQAAWTSGHKVLGTFFTKPAITTTYPHSGEGEKVDYDQAQWDVREEPSNEVLEFLTNSAFPQVLVHCAGITYLAPYEEMDTAKVQAVIDTNVMGTIRLLAMAAKNCKHGSRILIVSSVAAYTPMRLSAAYNASKAGQDALVRQAAREFGDRISVIGIRPGYVESTKLADYVMEQACNQRAMSPQGFHDYNKKTSITGRYPTMDEVVRTMMWAAFDAPAVALTGSFLNPSCGS